MRNFKELMIWQNAMRIGKETYDLVNKLSALEKYGIRSQMTRAAVSISRLLELRHSQRLLESLVEEQKMIAGFVKKLKA